MQTRRPTARELIAALDLKPNPKEGGFYSETYRSKEEIPQAALTAAYFEFAGRIARLTPD